MNTIHHLTRETLMANHRHPQDYDRRQGRDDRYSAQGGYGGYSDGDQERGRSRTFDDRDTFRDENHRNRSFDRGGAQSVSEMGGFDSAERRLADSDDDYVNWRQEQMSKLDTEYGEWRKERRKKFLEEFDKWRSDRASKSGTQQETKK